MDFQSEKSFGKLRLRAFQPYHQILCMLKHVEDVEDRSNTHKGCNAMYVEDVEDGKRTYTHILAHNFLNTLMDFQSEKSFGKLRLRAFQPYHQILCMLKHVEDVEDRSNTPKGCNAMYVKDIEDRSNLLWLVLISSTSSTLL